MAAQLNLDDLEIGEIEELAEIVGIKDMRQFAQMAENMPPKMLGAVAYLVKRRVDPTFTIEDARKLRLSELQALFEGLSPNADGGAPAASSESSTPPSSTSMAAP